MGLAGSFNRKGSFFFLEFGRALKEFSGQREVEHVFKVSRNSSQPLSEIWTFDFCGERSVRKTERLRFCFFIFLFWGGGGGGRGSLFKRVLGKVSSTCKGTRLSTDNAHTFVFCFFFTHGRTCASGAVSRSNNQTFFFPMVREHHPNKKKKKEREKKEKERENKKNSKTKKTKEWLKEQ